LGGRLVRRQRMRALLVRVRAVPRLRLLRRPALRLTAVAGLRGLVPAVLRGMGALTAGHIRHTRRARSTLLRSPRLAPGTAARRRSLSLGDARYPGVTSVGGQHDAFVRGPSCRLLLLVTLSALRHRDSYVWTYGIDGSRYRVTRPLRTHAWER
ncbi:MAG TPA: hypothetical protein VFG16_15150, partial [Streptomyces sp.]|nr:hypothetical protein [Streptomyces sp.]